MSMAIRIEKDKKENERDGIQLAEYYSKQRLVLGLNLLFSFIDHAGFQHFELGQLDEAVKHYDLAVRHDPQHGVWLYNRGLAKTRLDQIDEAIADFTSALANFADGDNERLYQARFNRGICYRRQGKLDKSIDDFKAALDKKKDRPSAFNNLGLSLFENGDFEESLH